MAIKQWPEDKIEEINVYLRFLAERAAGEINTGAAFIRNFVLNHPAYNRDSVVNEQISYDLIQMMSKLNDKGNPDRRGLLGERVCAGEEAEVPQEASGDSDSSDMAANEPQNTAEITNTRLVADVPQAEVAMVDQEVCE